MYLLQAIWTLKPKALDFKSSVYTDSTSSNLWISVLHLLYLKLNTQEREHRKIVSWSWQNQQRQT